MEVESQAIERPARFEVRVTADSHFAWIRTRLALERTMMAWLRTAVALIGFGFAIVQFFSHFTRIAGTRPAYLPRAPEYLGLALIACGIAALLIAIRQYWWVDRYLLAEPFAAIARMKEEKMRSPTIAIAILLAFVGLFALVAVLLRAV